MESTRYNRVRSAIQAELARTGMSQNRLAKASGLTQSQVNGFLCARHELTSQNVSRLLVALRLRITPEGNAELLEQSGPSGRPAGPTAFNSVAPVTSGAILGPARDSPVTAQPSRPVLECP